ncbi:hypothetical protein T4B_12230 [Trichinella pseudospiralis]|uniref:Uncharacterized protein n=1 Tax=Trichinella pseudospiralis TaxID=6337 RepID=A0A0V1ICP3_TRIPS|nr:hypothetical protein T4B_12230 [Trichinella pseudospiralis]
MNRVPRLSVHSDGILTNVTSMNMLLRSHYSRVTNYMKMVENVSCIQNGRVILWKVGLLKVAKRTKNIDALKVNEIVNHLKKRIVAVLEWFFFLDFLFLLEVHTTQVLLKLKRGR